MPQVLAPSDVLKLAMVASFYFYPVAEESDCVLSYWLLMLWKVLMFELVYKLLVQVCVARAALASLLVSLVLFGETCWNMYGLYMFFKWRETMQCREETLLAFKIALGLYLASNVSAVLLSFCRGSEPAKHSVVKPADPNSAEQSSKPHNN
jgi:hypothetical protein